MTATIDRTDDLVADTPVPHNAVEPTTGLRSVWRGRADDPAWVRPTLIALLTATAVLYLWGLSASGWGNSFYSAAVQAGTKSWKAFFYGSSDASNFITVDKSPASLWPAVISARIFGLSSWSILAPQAIEGVAAVGVLYLAVRRWFGPAAGLIAGAVFACTPVAALMFRFNNPDALLVLCLVLAAYWLTRAVEDGRTRWVVLVGLALGFAFLAKELQAFLVIPGFALAYLVAAPGTWWRRIRQGLVMATAMVVGAGWWIAIVVLTPAADRPYIGGSTNNTFWNVLFGYNGFGRLSGNETGSVGAQPGGAGTTGRWGPTGWTRMFNSQFGGEISWLLPAALALLVIGLVVTARKARTDRTRAALIVWGGWLLVTGIAFSLGKGIIHEYYAVALAPAIGALVGIGTTMLWKRRAEWWSRIAMVATLALTVWWLLRLLDRSPSWHASLPNVLVAVGIAVAVGILFLSPRRWAVGLIALGALVVGLASPVAASITTARAVHNGPLPTSGPATTGGSWFGPGGFGGARRAFAGRFGGATGFPGFPGAGPGPNATTPGANAIPVPQGGFPGGFPGGAGGPGNFAGRPGGAGGRGGIFGSPTPSKAVTALLKKARTGGYRWAAATIGATNGAGFQLASGQPIMAIGGFNGSDPTPTLAQFQQFVKDGKVHYFISSNFGVPGGGQSGTGSTISAWVQAQYTARTVSGVTMYDLSAPKAG
jgi:4-amino-4-deoxy-L-arabinose transferase and related glycosyltransferases of PMT family